MTLLAAALALFTQLLQFAAPLQVAPGQEDDLRNPQNQALFNEEDMIQKGHCKGKG